MIHQVAASMIDFAFCQITLVLVIIGGLLAYRLLLFWSSVCRLPGVFALLRDSRTTTCELSTTLSSTLRSSHDSARRLPIHLQPGQQRKPLRHPVSITHCTQLTQHRSGRVLLFLRFGRCVSCVGYIRHFLAFVASVAFAIRVKWNSNKVKQNKKRSCFCSVSVIPRIVLCHNKREP